MTGSKITSSLTSCVAFKWSLILSPCAGVLNQAGAAHLSLAGKGDSEIQWLRVRFLLFSSESSGQLCTLSGHP